jgi:hypothetical protein
MNLGMVHSLHLFVRHDGDGYCEWVAVGGRGRKVCVAEEVEMGGKLCL